MKTEPTEALRYMYTCIEPNVDTSMSIITRCDAGIAIEIAFKEGQSNPKIKQLEWERNGPICYVNQYNPIGYTAAITKWKFGENQYSVRLGLNDSNSNIKIFNSIDEAKDFVQKDFERRVKECLIIE